MRSPLAKARDEWLNSEEGKKCCEGIPTGQYLQNRLELAFLAGANFSTERIKEFEQLPPSKEILVCSCGWYGRVEDQDALGSECGCCPDCGNENLIWLNELQEKIKELEGGNLERKEYLSFCSALCGLRLLRR